MKNYRDIVTSSWNSMLSILIVMLIIDIIKYSMTGSYNELTNSLSHDPGATGLTVLICLICFNTLIQIAIKLADTTTTIKIIFTLTILYTTFLYFIK